jgi:hypothetical protein
MARKPDWMDFAHVLHKEAEAIRDKLPPGLECYLTLADYGSGSASFAVSLTHRETELNGFGVGNTPAKALEAAKEDLAKRAREKKKAPQIVSVKTLPAAKGGAS